MACLDENTVVEFIQGLLPPGKVAHIEEHLDNCPSCRLLLGEVAKLSFAAPSSKQLPPFVDEGGDVQSSVRRFSASSLGEALLDAARNESLLPDQVLAGRFRIVRRIGFGSFGTVYEAMDLQLGERVALKLLRPEVKNVPSLLNHLHHEIVVGRRISHPNVCRIYDLGTFGDTHFISMALVSGERLDVFLSRDILSTEKVICILQQICNALEAAHAQGVVHRDLKPSNIMIDEEEKVIVMDFGLARDLRAGPSQSGALIGSPAYWSPEQARGERATERSDLYTLGLIACDLFGVKHPHFGDEQHLKGIPRPYRAVIERCLRTRSNERFGSAKAVQEALQTAAKWAHWTGRPWLWGVAPIGLIGLSTVLFFLLRPINKNSVPPIQRDRDPTLSAPGPKQGSDPHHNGSPTLPSTRLIATQIPDDTGPAPADRPSSNTKRGLVLSHASRPSKKNTPGDINKTLKSGNHPRPKDTKKIEESAVTNQLFSELQKRLERFETERRRRGILSEDVPLLLELKQKAQQALAAKDSELASQALSGLENSLQHVQIDGTFIARKLERLNKLKGSLSLDKTTAQKITAIFTKVHERYFSGDYKGANAYLNSIWRLLGRSG